MENVTSSYIVNGRGYKLYCRYWEPKETPKAMVFLSHGFTEHSQYYENLGTTIADLGCFVLAHDHVGHGRSEGPRVQIESIDQYVDDVFLHTEMMKRKFPGLPVFYFGHSMGGAIGALASIKRPDYFTGVVLCGPALLIDPQAAGTFVRTLGRMIGWLLPNLPVIPLNYDLMTRDSDVTRTRKDDPLSWHGYCKAGWMYAMLKCIEDMEEARVKIKCPLLLVHGGDDKICSVEGSKILYDKCSSSDKTLKVYPNAYHNLLEEPEGVKEKVLGDIAEWLSQRIK